MLKCHSFKNVLAKSLGCTQLCMRLGQGAIRCLYNTTDNSSAQSVPRTYEGKYSFVSSFIAKKLHMLGPASITNTVPYTRFVRRPNVVCSYQFRNFCDHAPHEVRVIDEKGTNLGIMDHTKAQELADERNLTLHLVRRVTKSGEIATYKLLSQQNKEYSKAPSLEERPRQKKANVKEIQINSGIGAQDLLWKMRKVEQFLSEQSRVRVVVKKRSRSKIPAEDMFARLQDEFKNFGTVDGTVKQFPNGLSFYLRPSKNK